MLKLSTFCMKILSKRMVLNNYDVVIAIASRGKFLVQKMDFWETLCIFSRPGVVI